MRRSARNFDVDPLEVLTHRLERVAFEHRVELSAQEAEDAALALFNAPGDPLALDRGCIFLRNGRPCPGASGRECTSSCDIPF